MISNGLRRGAAIAAGTIVIAGLAVPSQAATQYFTDAAADTGSTGDITTVKVANSSAGNTRIGVRAQVGHLDVADLVTVWFDTNQGNAGPEFKVAVYPDSDGSTLRRLHAFGEHGGAVRCAGLRAAASTDGPAEIVVAVPRTCLGSPRQVAVSLRARFHDPRGQTIVDWAPAEESFFAAVGR